MMLVDEFSGLLKRKMGLDSRSIGAAAVERAVRHRMSATGVDDERDYLMRVQASPAEMQLLIESVVVPETWFFRYPESQQAMAQLACERLFAPARPTSVLRVLSLPCSSGEEPYSIAMALLDAGVPASRFQIDALDISERVVQFARRGLYGRNSFRGDALDYRDRYFTETGDGHQLSAQVMERVRFQSGNLFDAGLLAHAPAYDFVFCRNLLIYFDQATQERAVQVLRRHTREDGVLFVGPAETSLLTARRLPPVAMPHCFAFLARPRPDAAPAAASLFKPAALPAQPASRVPAPRPPAPLRPMPHPARPAAPPAVAVAAKSESEAEISLRQIEALADQGRVKDAIALRRAPGTLWRERRRLLSARPAAGCGGRCPPGAGRLPQGPVPAAQSSRSPAASGRAGRPGRRPRERAQAAGARRARRPDVTELHATLADVDDCWNRIGIRGDQSCPKLPEYALPQLSGVRQRRQAHLDRLPPQVELEGADAAGDAAATAGEPSVAARLVAGIPSAPRMAGLADPGAGRGGRRASRPAAAAPARPGGAGRDQCARHADSSPWRGCSGWRRRVPNRASAPAPRAC